MSIHEGLISKLLSDRSIIEQESTLLGDCFTNALGIDFPGLFTFVSVSVEHPLGGGELGHNGQPQVIHAHGA